MRALSAKKFFAELKCEHRVKKCERRERDVHTFGGDVHRMSTICGIGAIMTEKTKKWPHVIGRAMKISAGGDVFKCNERLSSGACRMRIARFGEPVNVERYLTKITPSGGGDVFRLSWRRGTMYWLYLWWQEEAT